MPAPRPVPPISRNPGSPLANTLVAAVLGLGWLVALTLFHRDLIIDEWAHLPVIRDFAAGRAPDLSQLPMVPVFHRVMALVHPLAGGTLSGLRAVQMACGVLTVWLLSAALREGSEPGSPGAALQVFLLPLLFPFFGLVYTEAFTVFLLAAAVRAQVRRWFLVAAALALAACGVRQTVIPWLPFLAIWAVGMPASGSPWSLGRWEVWRDRGFLRESLVRAGGYALAMLAILGVLLARGSLLAGDVAENRPGFNPAEEVFFLLVLTVLLLPLWLGRVGEGLGAWRRGLRRRSARAWGGLLVGALFWAGLVAGYRNAHPWNQGTEYFLRNAPLLWMEASVLARLGVAGLITLGAAGLVSFWRGQPHRRVLLLVLAFGMLSLLPLRLVEPRYLVFPFLFLHLFLRPDHAEGRRLTMWYLLITGVVCGGIASGTWMW